LEIDASSIEFKKKSIPDNVHTIFNFNLPFAIPVPDGLYEMSLGGKKVDLVIKRIQRKDIAGFSASGQIQLQYDKYGKSSFSWISMTFRYKIDLEEQGRTPLLLGDVRPRNKAKETVVRFLNRFIEAVRYTTKEFWVEQVRYQDLLSYNVAYWDGTNYLQGRMSLIDTGVGGIKIGGTPPFQVDNQTLDNLKDLLNQETPLDSNSMLFLNAKDACLQENFRLAMIEAVAALEVVLYNFIRVQGAILRLSSEELNDFIVKVGLTGNITMVLKMLTKGLEQIDDSTLRECRGAIKIRNKILHEGFQDVASTDTEKRIVAIEKMIDYLKKITPSPET
jgi:hypothetical protein